MNFPKFVNKNYTTNPMPFYRNPNPDKSTWIDGLGPRGGPNLGEVVTYYNAKFVSDAIFNQTLFQYYSENGILTLRDPTDLSKNPENPDEIISRMTFFTKQTFDREVDEIVYDENGKAFVSSFAEGIPNKRVGQRCFGDWCAFFAKDTQTQDWSRQATGYSFG
jgi:hypothetical protein